MLKPMTRYAMVLSLFSVVAACGFQLRGAVELPAVLQDTYIVSQNPFTGMARALRSQLKQSGGNIVDNKDQATAILTINSERAENRVLSVGSRGKATEYELYDEVNFSLTDNQGKTLIEAYTLRLTRDLVFDQNELLGKLSEADGIHRQMRASLARQIMLRIDAGLKRP